MSKANAQKGQSALQPLATFDRDTSLARGTRTGRNDHTLRLSLENPVDRDMIVAKYLDVQSGIYLTQPLHEVVGERVVVIDDDDHSFGLHPLIDSDASSRRKSSTKHLSADEHRLTQIQCDCR